MSPRSTTVPNRHAFSPRSSPGFTIIELLVVVSIIALLIGILLPAISKARDTAKVTESLANLRNLAAAHQSYAAEWNDRQLSLLRDDIGLYSTIDEYEAANGQHPDFLLGGAWIGSTYGQYIYNLNESMSFIGWPINPIGRFGWFRAPNFKQFNQYVGGKFYDKTFFAPKDRAVLDAVGDYFDRPGEFAGDGLEQALWPSYCLSPAALFSPQIFKATDPDLHAQGLDSMGGGAFRCPSMSQARFPSLKTQFLEHHWLQSNRGNICNPAFTDGLYDGCEPYYFNMAMESAPATTFYDGSVRVMGVREAATGDEQTRANPPQGQVGGLYFRPGDPGFAESGSLTTSGYFLNQTYDLLSGDDLPQSYRLGYHILTKDGILGRDTLGGQ